MQKRLIPATSMGSMRSKISLLLNYKFALHALAQGQFVQGQYND
jgi:hypothetical protein